MTADKKETLPHKPSDILRKFVACLHHVISRSKSDAPISLVLNGDILELALAGTNEAAMTFECFIKLLFNASAAGKKLAREIFYLPGNHDHHLWNTAKETQYVEKYLRTIPARRPLEAEYYATNMFYNQKLATVPAYFLDALIQRWPALSDISFKTVYPNLAVLNPDKSRAVVFNHGHYIESIYSLMTRLKDTFFPGRSGPVEIWDLEAENGAWIDFFWSTLGRSGDVGTGVALIYDKMQDEQQFDRLLENLAQTIKAQLPLEHLIGGLESKLITIILKHTLGKLASREVDETGSTLSPDATAGLKHYLENYVLREIRRGNRNKVPEEVTFIFGHTHKPFEDVRQFDGYNKPVQLLNSGGWVVDTREVEALHGGAIILVDDQLNVASIRMYNEDDPSRWPAVHVSAAVKEGNPLYEWLTGLITPDKAPWASFAKSVQQAVNDHRDNLLFNIARNDTEKVMAS